MRTLVSVRQSKRGIQLLCIGALLLFRVVTDGAGVAASGVLSGVDDDRYEHYAEQHRATTAAESSPLEVRSATSTSTSANRRGHSVGSHFEPLCVRCPIELIQTVAQRNSRHNARASAEPGSRHGASSTRLEEGNGSLRRSTAASVAPTARRGLSDRRVCSALLVRC